MCQVVVIGDYMIDIDTNYKQIGIAPDHKCPVVTLINEETRHGAAGAVVEMLKGFDVDVLALGENIKSKCIKHRYFMDGVPQYRKDDDYKEDITEDQCRQLMNEIPSSTEYIILSDYGKGVVTYHLVRSLVENFPDIKIIVDPSKKNGVYHYIGCYGILPNALEARVDDISWAPQIAKNLLRHYPCVGLKLGDKGIVSGTRESGLLCIRGKDIQAVDTCGAGDMVISALVTGLLKGEDWYGACIFANEMAAKKCMQIGATPIKIDQYANNEC